MKKDFNNLWVEKYRPKTLNELIIPDNTKKTLESYRTSQEIPHLCFISSPGTGKTTTAKIIVNDILGCDYIYINASDENGIDTIRTKVIGFAQTKAINSKQKVVILDEADGLSQDAQRTLRNVMEEYSNNTRFILTANYKHKVITALQSRCQVLDFDQSAKEVIKHCIGILKKENVVIPKETHGQLLELIRTNLPDIRKIINELQKYSVTGTLDIKSTTITAEFIETIFNSIDGDICEARKFVIENEGVFQNDYHNLMKQLLQFIYKRKFTNLLHKRESILIITEYMYRHSFVIDPEINFFACMINLQKVLG